MSITRVSNTICRLWLQTLQRSSTSIGWALIVLLSFPGVLWAEDIGPTASFYATPSSGSLSTVFTFDASNSYDAHGVSKELRYRWNFNYGEDGTFTDWDDESLGSFQYAEAGEKTVALEVMQEDGATDRTYSTINVNESSNFSGWFDVSPKEGDVNTVFTFEADIATTSSVPKSDYQVRWDFEGDGIYDTDFSSSLTAYHNYSDTGYFNPQLEILSPDGTRLVIVGYDDDDADEISYVYVSFDQTPQASVSVYPSTGSVQTTFYFDASDSFDSQDHRDLDYRWDFEGDGQFDLDWSDETNPTFQYTTPGTYQTILQIRDAEGNTDEVFLTIPIAEKNFAPEATFSITSTSGLSDKSIGTTSTLFTFNASSSKDEEDTSSDLQVRWDFDGDGDYDTTFDTEKRIQHRYLDAGTYTVMMQVLDSSGLTDTTQKTVTVVANDAPIASFEVSPLRGTVGTTFYFDASSSYDSQYQLSMLQVRWDFEGDGSFDTPFSTDKTVTHLYERPGDYEPTLQVRDPEGQTSETTIAIEVIDSTSPTAELVVDVTSGTFSTLFHFDASGSSDGETAAKDLWFRWDFNYTGANDITYDLSWSHTKTKSLYFDQVGEVNVKVEVKDAEGNISTAIQSVNIHWASAYIDHLKTKGILRGYSGGDLAPDQSITRAELLKMALKATGVSESGHSYQGYFSDVKQVDWFDVYVEKAYEMGFVSGYSDGTFRPNAPVTRAEAVKILLNVFGLEPVEYENNLFNDVYRWDWYADSVATAYDYALIQGYSDKTFRPEGLMTRGEAAKILSLALQQNL